MRLFLIIFFLTGVTLYTVYSETTPTIPNLLKQCYTSNFTNVNPPLNLPLLIELIRKIELNETYTFNLRKLAISLLTSVEFDGINKTISKASGRRYNKYKLVLDYLVGTENFPEDCLNTQELCMLHNVISNTIHLETDMTCNVQTNMQLESMDKDEFPEQCYLKGGTIKTKWGPISAGELIMGIGSSLEQSTVTFNKVSRTITEKTNGTQTKSNVINSQVSFWVSTVAGDLAGMILNQASLNLTMGKEGNWNDTKLPTGYILNFANRTDTDYTVDEVLSGIDATILGTYIKSWIDRSPSLRLSQVLDMYYSDRGIAYDNSLKASNRSAAFAKILEQENLGQQIFGACQILSQIGNYEGGSLYDEDFQKLSEITNTEFIKVKETILKNIDNVETSSSNIINTPIELLIIFDDSYDAYTSKQIVYGISEAIQVSYYGSKIGIINGQSGIWMTNVTGELFEIYSGLYQNQNTWPTGTNPGSALETAINFYQDKTNRNCSNEPEKPMAKSIILFNRSGRLTGLDQNKTQRNVQSIKNAYPEINIIYVSEDANGFFKGLSQTHKNDSLLSPVTDVLSLVNQITDKYYNIPTSVVNYYCGDSQVRFEDYITPSLPTYYEVHEEYVRRSNIKIKFKNSNYGGLNICPILHTESCKALTVNDEISFNSRDLCSDDSPCNVKFLVTTNNSEFKCAETDCRYPDQIRIEIYMYPSSSASLVSSFILIIFTLIIGNL